VRRRQAVPPAVGLFERLTERWAELGYVPAFGDGGVAPATREQAARFLVERSALTAGEVAELHGAARGEPSALDMSQAQAESLLARWLGPIPGLHLLPLPHWTAS
jgi:hypothetical protein